jgi:hypothetical protein
VPLLVSLNTAVSAAAPSYVEQLDALSNADQFGVLRVEPARPGSDRPNSFHGCPIKSRKNVTDISQQRAIAAALKAWFRYAPKEGASTDFLNSKACIFSPHHALHIIKNGHTYDWVICFGCEQIKLYKDPKNSFSQESQNDFIDFEVEGHKRSEATKAAIEAALRQSR